MEKLKRDFIQREIQGVSDKQSISSRQSLYQRHLIKQLNTQKKYAQVLDLSNPELRLRHGFSKFIRQDNLGRMQSGLSFFPSKTSRKDYNSLYAKQRIGSEQKRSSSSILHMQGSGLQNAVLNRGFNPAEYLKMKDAQRNYSLDSTFNQKQACIDTLQNKTSPKINQTHRSLPPVSNLIFKKSRFSKSPTSSIRVFHVDDKMMKDPVTKKFIQGKRIIHIGNNKYVTVDKKKQKSKNPNSSINTKNEQKAQTKVIIPYTRSLPKKKQNNTTIVKNQKQIIQKLLQNLNRHKHTLRKKKSSEPRILEVIDRSFKIVQKNYNDNVQKMQVSTSITKETNRNLL